MTRRLLAFSTVVIVLAAGGIGGAHAQSFYEGKTVRIIVGPAPVMFSTAMVGWPAMCRPMCRAITRA